MIGLAAGLKDVGAKFNDMLETSVRASRRDSQPGGEGEDNGTMLPPSRLGELAFRQAQARSAFDVALMDLAFSAVLEQQMAEDEATVNARLDALRAEWIEATEELNVELARVQQNLRTIEAILHPQPVKSTNVAARNGLRMMVKPLGG